MVGTAVNVDDSHRLIQSDDAITWKVVGDATSIPLLPAASLLG